MPASVSRKAFVLVILFVMLFQHVAYADETLIVSATVPANATNFPNSITSSQTDPLAPGDTANYTITYGSTLATNSSITVEAQWVEGTIQGDSTPTVDVVDYLSGSATNAYGTTPPVIDTVNRKIDWTITSFPAHDTNEIVSFSLKANDNYRGASPVNFTVVSRVSGPGVTTGDSKVDQIYQFPTSVPGPTATPGPGATQSPTPTPLTHQPGVTPTNSEITGIVIDSLSDTTAQVTVTTKTGTTALLKYGTTPTNLTSLPNQSDFLTSHTFTLSGLTPNTTYYLQIVVTDAAGKKTTSEFYTFHSANGPATAQVNPQSLVITSSAGILLNGAENESNPQSYVSIPTGSSFQFRFSLLHPETTKQVQVLLTCAKGTTTTVQLLEAALGVYTGQLTAPNTSSLCKLIVRVNDTHGNIFEQTIATILVSKPLTITDAHTRKPIEHARVEFWVFDQHAKKFVLLTNLNSSLINPTYSDSSGIVPSVLQLGTYKISVSAIGYDSRTLQFTLGPKNITGYPQVALKPARFSFLSLFNYYLDILRQGATNFMNTLRTTLGSGRMFNLVATLSVIFFFLVTLLAFSVRIHLPLLLLPLYLFHHLRQIFTGTAAGKWAKGEIYDAETNAAIGSAHVSIINNQNRILAQGITNRYGEFRISLPQTSEPLSIGIVKRGYHPVLYKDLQVTTSALVLALSRDDGILPHAFFRILGSLHEILGSLFETLLVASFLFEIAFGITNNFTATLPFLILTSTNLFLWIRHSIDLKHPRES